jgi:hypothetical protein
MRTAAASSVPMIQARRPRAALDAGPRAGSAARVPPLIDRTGRSYLNAGRLPLL